MKVYSFVDPSSADALESVRCRLTRTEHAVFLFLISRRKFPDLEAVAAHMGWSSPSQARHACTALQGFGLLERVPHPDSARKAWWQVSELGRAAALAWRPSVKAARGLKVARQPELTHDS